jgi:hypothetical protein
MAVEKNNNLPARLAAFGAVALLAVAGCRNHRGANDARGETFPADGDERAVDRFIHVQSAAAARTDATLNAYHFDRGHELNSLGRQKLDLMTRDDDALPMVVYLDLPRQAGSVDGHEESVRVYLADRGIADAKVEVRTGPNLEHSRPAKDGLRGLKRLELESGDPGEESSDSGMTGGPSELSTATGSK